MANENKGNNGVENNNGRKAYRNKERERLVVLFGNEKGESVSVVHAFIRPLLWALLWALNWKLVQAEKLKGEAKGAAEQSLVRKVIRMVVTAGATDALEKARANWLSVALADKPEQAEALSEVAGALSDRKARVVHHAMLFDYDTGKAETGEQAASRLIRAAVFSSNKVIAASYRIHRDALIKAGVISAEKAKEVTDAARKERDEQAKKAAEARKAAEPSPAKDDKKKEEKKKVA